MSTDLHEEALEFVVERLREIAASGCSLRVGRAALAEYAAAVGMRSPLTTRSSERRTVPSPARSEERSAPRTASEVLETAPERDISNIPSRRELAVPILPAVASGDPLERSVALQALERRAAACERCTSIANSRRSVVQASGNVHAEIVFVGDVPSADEDAAGEPFRGAAGEMMDKMLTAMGLKRDEVFLVPSLRCRPDAPIDVPRKPTDAERSACSPYLMELIAVVRPRAIVLMGAEAYRALFGREVIVGRVRSVWSDCSGIPVMTTFHPSHLITNPAVSVKRQVWEDLLKVLELLGHPISEKQRGYFLPRR